jgi:hypothetical protein
MIHDGSMFRSFLLSQKPKFPLFGALINAICSDSEAGVRIQACEILKMLLDPQGMDNVHIFIDSTHLIYI